MKRRKIIWDVFSLKAKATRFYERLVNAPISVKERIFKMYRKL